MTKLSFEKSIEKLESIVKSLEDTTISLDESLKLYESGIALINSCRKTLEEAERKVEKLSTSRADSTAENSDGE